MHFRLSTSYWPRDNLKLARNGGRGGVQRGLYRKSSMALRVQVGAEGNIVNSKQVDHNTT